MIGMPTDFRHTGHIGSADMHNESAGSDDVDMVSSIFSNPDYYIHI